MNINVNNSKVHFEIGQSLYFGYWDDHIFALNGRADPIDGFGWAQMRRTNTGLELLASATAESLGIVTGTLMQTEPPVLGDVNQDGTVDLLDIAPFVDLLTSGGILIEADINMDGTVDLADVVPFVELVAG